MKKLFKEFKEFINRGSDLAVGMIIGSAFTAIVNSLVKGILTPLINWIPGADGTGALQTVLRPAVTDEAGNVITEALILDWGSVISAIVTFLCTAIVLFLLIKLFNKIKETGNKAKDKAESALKQVIKKEESQETKEEQPVEEKPQETKEEQPVEEKPVEMPVAEPEQIATETQTNESTEELLKQILEQLKQNNG